MDHLNPLLNILANVFAFLMQPVATEISYLVHLERKVDILSKQTEELLEKREDFKVGVTAAQDMPVRCAHQLKGWIQRAEDIEREVNSIKEDLQNRRGCFCGMRHVNCCSNHKLGKRVAEKLNDVKELLSKGNFEIPNGSRPTVRVKPVPVRPSVGLDVMLQKLTQFLIEDEVGIIGIYGMGGVGKTTLLRKVNNEFLARTHDFDVVIWVVVSNDYVAEKIQKAIIVRLGLPWDETQSQDDRAIEIFSVLSTKKFVLFLDDVWKRLDLEKIGIPLPDKSNKCKVIFSTRTIDVCNDMDAKRQLKVEFLNEDEARLLFQEKVGNNELLNSPSIKPLAEAIIRRCGGLPLALITTGRAMANKETKEEWEHARQVLEESPSELRGMEDVFTHLKLSYDNLRDDTLKACMLYCSLFPEDYSIEKEQLVEYWIGEGYLDGSNKYFNAHNKGHALIGSLKDACLLEIGEEKTQVKMHDVIRGFALWIASECGRRQNKFLVQASVGLAEAPGVERWKEAERISLLDNEINRLIQVPDCPKLLTLLLQWNDGLNRISDGFFRYMPTLRVLDLSFTSLREIPVDIGNLVELRHLDLSGTKITILPTELGKLSKLRHLDLLRTHYLRTIPTTAISSLSSLQVLNLYYSYANWNADGSKDERISFEDLEQLTHLISLGITVTESGTLHRLSLLERLPRYIQYLYVKECEGLICLPLTSTPGNAQNLRRLSINNCYDLEELAIEVETGENWLPNLEVLALHGLPNLTTIWRNQVTSRCLQNLRSINIWNCDKLKDVTWVSQLQCLEVIYIFYCNGVEQIVGGTEVEESAAFPRLRTISIRDLPELKSICQHPLVFPSLETMAVIGCPKLNKLPLKVLNALSLPTIYGKEEWWSGLQWDDKTLKSAFATNFIPV